MQYSGTFIQWLFNPSMYIKSSQGKSKHNEWAKDARKLYKHTCLRCGYSPKGGLEKESKRHKNSKMRVEAHHSYPKRYYPRLTYKLWNARLLCEDCHVYADDALHKMVELKNCNPKTFNKWLRTTKNKELK